jgi:methyl-accepting chemotaxis protein PixJ
MTQNLPKPSPESSRNGHANGRAVRPNGMVPPPPPSRYVMVETEIEPNSIEAVQMPMQSMEQSPQVNSFLKNWTEKNFWRKLSLKNKATMLAVAIGTLPLLLIGGTAYYLASQELSDKVLTAQRSATSEVLDKVAFYMRERYGDIQIMSNLDVFADSQQRLTSTRQEKQAALDQFVKAYPVYNSIAVFDLNGNVLAQSQGEPLSNHKDRNYFQTVLKTGQPIISDPQISKSSGILSIHTAAPIRDRATGQMIAIVRARLPVSHLHDLLATIAQTGEDQGNSIKAETQLYLTDRAGQIFAGSGDNYKNLANPEKAAARFPVYEALKAENQAAVKITTDSVVAFAPMPKYSDSFRADLPNLSWGTISTVDKSTALAAQRHLLTTLALGTALAALGVGALAAWLANRATRPIVDAANAAARIGQGDLDTRLIVEGEDELAALGQNLNTMAAQLQEIVKEQETSADKARFLTSVTAESRSVSEDELNKTFDQALEKTRQFLNVDRVVIYRFKPDWSGYISNESVVTGFPKALNDKIEDPCIPQTLLDAYCNGRVVPTSDVFRANFHPDHLKLMERLQIRANLVVPVLNQGRLFGLLVAHHCAQTHLWQQAEIDFMTQLATQLGVAISVQEVEESRRTAEVLAAEQTQLKEGLQRRALELLMEVDPISRGDLTIRAKVTEDEIGTIADSYNATINSLKQIVLQVQSAAKQVVSTPTRWRFETWQTGRLSKRLKFQLRWNEFRKWRIQFSSLPRTLSKLNLR